MVASLLSQVAEAVVTSLSWLWLCSTELLLSAATWLWSFLWEGLM